MTSLSPTRCMILVKKMRDNSMISMLQGSLKYDANRTYDGGGDGMRVPIVLQNLDTGWTVPVLPNSNGDWTIRNVPDGNYQIVEQYGYPTNGSSDVDYSSGSVKPILTSAKLPTVSQYNDPSVGSGKTAKAGSTDIDGVGETTKNFRISGTDVYDNRGTKIDSNNNNMFNRNKTVYSYLTISNGPVKYTPLNQTGTDTRGLTQNVFTNLDNGTFGSYPQGQPAESAPDAMKR